MLKIRFHSFGAPCALITAALALGACANDSPITDAATAGQQPPPSGMTVKQTVDTLMRLAASTAKSGDYASAATLYRQAHAKNPLAIAPLIGLAKSLTALGAMNEAADIYKKALAKDPNNVVARYGLGNVLVALDKPTLAIEHLQKAVAVKDSPRFRNGLGVAHDMLGQHAEAEGHYRAGLKLAPEDLTLRNNLGLSLSLAGKHDAAIEILRSVAANPAATKRQRLNLALAYGLAGENDSAASVARMELDETAVQSNLTYYRTLRSMRSSKATMDAIGTHGGFSATDAPGAK